MPLYSLADILNKTVVLRKNMNAYKASDIITLGTKGAKPSFVLHTGESFTCWSWLEPKPAGQGTSGVFSAERTYYYLMFYRGIELYCVAIIEGAFSLEAFNEQGILTVKETLEKQAEDEKSIFDKIGDKAGDLFGGIEGTVKTIVTLAIVLGVIYVVVSFILPGLKEYKKA